MYLHFFVIFGENYYNLHVYIVFHIYQFCHHVEQMFWFHGPNAYWTYAHNRVCLLGQFYYRLAYKRVY